MKATSFFNESSNLEANQFSEVMETDVLIIGGGPAGLSAGIYAERNGLETVIIEKSKVGGQVLETTVVENYPGMKQVEGSVLADILSAHALEYVNIFERERVCDIIPGKPLIVITDKRVIQTKSVIIATGAKRRSLGLLDEGRFLGKGLSYSPIREGNRFRGKKAMVVGGGDSAITEALYLKKLGVDVTVIHRSGNLDAQQALINQLDEQAIPVLFHAEVKALLGDNHLEKVRLFHSQTGKSEDVPTEGLFISIGYVPAFELAEKIGLKISSDCYVEHQSCRTNVPGIYVAGDITGGFKQIITASSQGAEAALTVFNDIKSGRL